MQRWLSPIPLLRKFSLELLTSQCPGCLGSFPKFIIPMALPRPAGDQKISIMAQFNIVAPAVSVVGHHLLLLDTFSTSDKLGGYLSTVLSQTVLIYTSCRESRERTARALIFKS